MFAFVFTVSRHAFRSAIWSDNGGYEEAHLSSSERFSLQVLFDKSEIEIEAEQLVIELLGRRKPIRNIRPRDLRQYPIWEFAFDEERFEGMDDTWIRPVKRKTVPKNAYSQIVAADFTTQAGKELHGVMMVTKADDHMEIQSGRVVRMGYHKLPAMSKHGTAKKRAKASRKERDELARVLAVEEGEVFPMRYRLKALVSGERTPRESRIG